MRSAIVPFVAKRLEMVVVANVADDVAVRFPVIRLAIVPFVAVRFVKKPVTAVKRFEKKLDDVAFVKLASVANKLLLVLLIVVSELIDVVASVEVPYTRSVPLAIKLPCSSARKPRLSTQFVPFQVSVELVAVPTNTAPNIVFQNVDVPVVKRV